MRPSLGTRTEGRREREGIVMGCIVEKKLKLEEKEDGKNNEGAMCYKGKERR